MTEAAHLWSRFIKRGLGGPHARTLAWQLVRHLVASDLKQRGFLFLMSQVVEGLPGAGTVQLHPSVRPAGPQALSPSACRLLFSCLWPYLARSRAPLCRGAPGLRQKEEGNVARPALVPLPASQTLSLKPWVGFFSGLMGQSRVMGPPLAAFPASVVEERRAGLGNGCWRNQYTVSALTSTWLEGQNFYPLYR